MECKPIYTQMDPNLMLLAHDDSELADVSFVPVVGWFFDLVV